MLGIATVQMAALIRHVCGVQPGAERGLMCGVRIREALLCPC